MKLRRIFSAFFALSLLCTCFSVTMSASAASSAFYETYYYYQSSGNNKYFSVELVNENTGALDVGSEYVGGLGGVCVVPNPKGNPEKPLAIKHPGIKDAAIALADVDFIRLNYDYSGSYRGRMMLKLGKEEFNLTKDIYVYSMETVKNTSSTRVQMLNFDVREVTEGYIFDGGIIPSLEIYPFAEKPSGDLSATKDYISFSDIIFARSDSTTMQTVLSDTTFRKYPIYFMPGSGNITGTAPETKFAAVGKTVTLPECTFTREGYSFAGWLAANGNDTYAPGDTYTVVKRNIDSYQTGRMYFVATWEKNEESTGVNVASSSAFFSAFVTSAANPGIRDASEFTKNYNFDGVNTVKFEFFPDESNSDRKFSLDCYSWGTLPFDITKYKYLAVPYYYKTSAEKPLATTPTFTFQKTGATCLSDAASAKNTSGSIVANQWAVMTFEFDITDATSSIGAVYVADSGSDIIKQTHLRPFGNTAVSKFKEDDEFYLGDFILCEEVPSSAPLLNRSFIDGDGDGNFRPTQTITNAEAAAMLVKAMGILDDVLEGYTETSYSDITSAHWAYNYVCYLENIGVLKPGADAEFEPGAEAQREDFVKQVVVAKGGETDSTAVAMQLAAGNKKLSRAEAVNIINSVYFDRNYDAGDVEPLFEDFFYDVKPEAWFYQDIVLAAMPTISYRDAKGVNKVAGVYESSLGIPESLTESAVEYVENLDVITAERIEEIRNTASEWKVKDGGTVYYISTSTGSASNAGTSMSMPKKISTLEEIGGETTNPLSLKPGDVVLFKRGDIFRGFMYAKSGVTYSAYGDGEKPVLTRSPEDGADSSKWTLVHEDTSVTPSKKIWQYTGDAIDTMLDVGAVMLMKKTTGTVTGDPKTYAHTVAYKEVPSYRKVTKQGTPTVVKVFVYDEEGNVKKDKDGNPITKDVIEIQNIEDKTDEGKYYVRGYLPYQNNNADGTYDTVGIPFDFKTELDRDLEFFHDTNDTEHMETTLRSNLNTTFVNNTGITEIQTPNVKTATGPLYLRCDADNPGTFYNRIEFNPHGSVLRVGNEDAVTVDNLCFMYFGTHGVSASTCNNLTVRNCEIGWGGGTVQNYNPKNNNPGYVTRLGNGVEVFGGCRNFRIDNCYVYQIYDAGITHQYSGSGTASCLMEGVCYTNNVLEDNIYNIEYFLGLNSIYPDLMRFMNGVLFENNICRRAGYGWGVQRPDANLPSNIRAGSGNLASDYVIRNNIFDRTVDFQMNDSRISSMDSNLRVNTGFPQCSIPYFVNNDHVQVPGRIILECGKSRLCGIRSEQSFIDIDGIGNEVYMYPDDFSKYVTKHILYQPSEY